MRWIGSLCIYSSAPGAAIGLPVVPWVCAQGAPASSESFLDLQRPPLGIPRAPQGPLGLHVGSESKNIDFPKVFHGSEPKTLILLRFFKSWTKKQTPFSGQMCQIHRTVASKWASGNSALDPLLGTTWHYLALLGSGGHRKQRR